MMVYGVPVGRMFWAGAPRLLAAGMSIIPCHPTGDARIALEAYPALVARKWIDMRPYKNDTRAKQTSALRDARCDLITGLRATCRDHYGFVLDLADDLAVAMREDPSGDLLDASLCAVQAAWASGQSGYGVPPVADPLEGWIVDPATAMRQQQVSILEGSSLRLGEAMTDDTQSPLAPGLAGQASVTVSADLTAAALGSGNVSAFSTPALIALMEGAAVAALEGRLPAEQTSVGTRLDVRHLAATPVGMTVRAAATLTDVDGRRLVFAVEAHDDVEQVGAGTHERFVVDRARFEARVAAKGG